jgi:hypothetical protein
MVLYGCKGMYSSRLKYLLSCGSVVLSPWPHTQMEEFWYHLLDANINYIPTSLPTLGNHFNDIITHYNVNVDKLSSIASSSYALSLLLDRNGAICYYQRLIVEYATITLPSSLPSLSSIEFQPIENALTSLLNAGLDSSIA